MQVAKPTGKETDPSPAEKEVGLHCCTPCSFRSGKMSLYINHMMTVHEHPRNFECRKCAMRFSAAVHYKQHFKLCQISQSNVLRSGTQEEFGNVSVDTDSSSYTEPSCVSQATNHDNLHEVELMRLCRKLEGYHRASKSVVDTVFQSIESMFTDRGVHIDVSSFSTNKLRLKTYKDAGIFAKPVAVSLGNSKGYVVPLRELLQHLSRHPDYDSAFRAKRAGSEAAPGVLADFHDGIRSQGHPVLKAHSENVLRMIIYIVTT